MVVGKNIIRSSIPKLFFSKKEKIQIENAIFDAEKGTSGEIRLHVTKKVKGDLMVEAKKTFENLAMTETKYRNGVLIFFAMKNRSFVIIGDKGINEKIGQNGWNDIAEKMQSSFQNDLFADGVSKGVSMIGEVLHNYFKYDEDAAGELPNDISYG